MTLRLQSPIREAGWMAPGLRLKALRSMPQAMCGCQTFDSNSLSDFTSNGVAAANSPFTAAGLTHRRALRSTFTAMPGRRTITGPA